MRNVNAAYRPAQTRCVFGSQAFVVAATAWLDPDQQQRIVADTGCPEDPISGGRFTAIVTPQGELLGEPLRSGQGEVIGDLDFVLIDKRKAFMDSSGHCSRPELLSLLYRSHA